MRVLCASVLNPSLRTAEFEQRAYQAFSKLPANSDNGAVISSAQGLT